MNALGDIFRNAGNAFSCAWQVLCYLGSFLCLLLLPKALLAARVLALQSQLAVCKHRIDAGKAPQPRFNQAFRILWVILSKLLDRWEDLAQVMKPGTVKEWHTARSLWSRECVCGIVRASGWDLWDRTTNFGLALDSMQESAHSHAGRILPMKKAQFSAFWGKWRDVRRRLALPSGRGISSQRHGRGHKEAGDGQRPTARGSPSPAKPRAKLGMCRFSLPGPYSAAVTSLGLNHGTLRR